MGTDCKCISLGQQIRNTDRSSMMFVLFFLFLGLNLELSEAACNENGCCYCNSVTGHLWNAYSRGQCNYGTFCGCAYSTIRNQWYGVCFDPYCVRDVRARYGSREQNIHSQTGATCSTGSNC